MQEKEIYDVRGGQSKLFRLLRFDTEGLVHLVFYRIAIVIAALMVISMAIGVKYVQTPFINATRVLMLLLWIMFTPQLFETIKAMSLIASRGVVFGKLNPSFMSQVKRNTSMDGLLYALPYVVLAVWAVGLIGLVKLWFV